MDGDYLLTGPLVKSGLATPQEVYKPVVKPNQIEPLPVPPPVRMVTPVMQPGSRTMIPAVVAAPPGVLSALDIPLVTGKGLMRIVPFVAVPIRREGEGIGMRKKLALLVSAVTLAAISTADAKIAGNTIGATAELLGDGHAAEATVLIACTEGHIRFTLTLTQDGMSGRGKGAGACTGTLTEYPVTVVSKGAAFEPGHAEACATAVNLTAGRVVDDVKSWCRADGVELIEGDRRGG